MDVSATVQAIDATTTQHASLTDADKVLLLKACSCLMEKLENPEQKLMKLFFDPIKTVAIRLAVDMKIFDAGAQVLGREVSVTLQQLSQETDCEALLIKRVMRVLVDLKTFEEIDVEIFKPLPLVMMFVSASPIAPAVVHATSHLMHVYGLPMYFEENGYKSPQDAFDGPFQRTLRTNLHLFDWLVENPKYQNAFNVTMAMTQKRFDDSKWFDVFPVEELLDQPSLPEVFAVDIGGGTGHNMIQLKERFPKILGKLMVQDIAAVTDNIKSLPEGIEAVTYNFFDPQPIHGAKVYLLARIIHDWPDKQARIILQNIRNAMGPDSLLLLSESVLPERDVAFMPAAMDIMMMANLAALERTESQYRELLNSVGLKLVKVWRSKPKESDLLNKPLEQFVLEAHIES